MLETLKISITIFSVTMDKSSIQSWADLQNKQQVTRDEVVDFYDSWAVTYDESVEKSASADIALAAVLSQFPDETGRDEIEILDIAAGTGRVGIKLFENGFRQIDAIEPSQEMLNILQRKANYRNVYRTMLGGGNKASEINDGSYDLIIISGGFAKSHLPVDCLDEVIRLGRKGSIFINRMTAKNIEILEEYTHLEPYMDELERKGAWTKIDRIYDENQTFSGPSLTHIYRIEKS